ncbi:MAG: MarR family transcriptional regulator [Desulfurococcaceae archaeon]
MLKERNILAEGDDLMLTYEYLIEKLNQSGIDETISRRLIEEYEEVKKAYFIDDYEEVIKHAGKFSEAILALIENKISGEIVNLDKIRFDEICKKIESLQKPTAKEEILTLAIPRVSRSVYTLRSKKDIVHVKTVDPDFIDAYYCAAACDWMLAEIVLLLLEFSEEEAKNLIESVFEKRLPIVEKFEDGTVIILRKDLPRSDEILVILYYFYPKRLSNQELARTAKIDKANLSKYLQRLEKDKLIHRTIHGNKLTRLGIKYVEEKILTKI